MAVAHIVVVYVKAARHGYIALRHAREMTGLLIIVKLAANYEVEVQFLPFFENF